MSKQKISLAILLLIAVAALLASQPWKQTSEEMKALREIEKQLPLPEPAGRKEQDRGEFLDSADSPHYERYIILYYDDSKEIESALQDLPKDGWKHINTLRDNEAKWYAFVHEGHKMCITAHIDPNTDGHLPHGVFLEPATSDGCRTYFDGQ